MSEPAKQEAPAAKQDVAQLEEDDEFEEFDAEGAWARAVH